MTRSISFLASLLLFLDLLFIFLAFSWGITRRMRIAFPIITLPARRVTRASNNREAADEYKEIP
ncbi:hypothetical protein [Bacillus thuringiensis]|uniref:hypothetical protein n=1 Tax=Bacillus thuringiensis TaxID=1428 RepID=UPI0011460B0B|nr:hypothetical protein [Bacillus thuringiensis]